MKQFMKILVLLCVCGTTNDTVAAVNKEPAKQEAKAKAAPKATVEDEDIYAAPAGDESDDEDVLEVLNRIFFSINLVVDKVIVAPISAAYKEMVPDPAKEKVSNFLENLNTPLVALNFFLQGNLEKSWGSLVRGVTNSTIGILGLFDPAAEMGYAGMHTNFGETLAFWWTGRGPYMVLPLIGPSDFTDAVGRAGTWYADPLNNWLSDNSEDGLVWARTGLPIVDTRYPLLEPFGALEENSLDFYVAVRSLYLQQRAAKMAKIKGEVAPVEKTHTPTEEVAEAAYEKVGDKH